jgi:hypothetical protein
MDIDLKIPDKHLPMLKGVYRSMYLDFWKRYEPLMQEWNAMFPILKQLGIIDKDSKFIPDKENETPVLPASNSAEHHVNGSKTGNGHDVGKIQSSMDINPEFNTKWTWSQKAVFVLEKVGRPMTPKQLVTVLTTEYDKALPWKLAMNSIPATLSMAAKEGKFFKRYLNDKDEFVYELIK